MADAVFTFTNSMQTYVVPAGVTQLTVRAVGGCGHSGTGPVPNGPADVTGKITVTPGETLRIYVGGNGGITSSGQQSPQTAGLHPGNAPGGQGYNGGGGGGASTDVRRGGTALSNRVIVAGGSGGSGGNNGGVGGRSLANGSAGGWGGSGSGGGGGSQTSGGSGGSSYDPAAYGSGGGLGFGGNSSPNGTNYAGGGGGGGGYYGGGGGGTGLNSYGAGGGGGSSTVPVGGTVTTYPPNTLAHTGRVEIILNSAPNAPTLTSLTNNEVIDKAAVNRASHSFSDPDSGDSQSKFDIRYRIVGTSTWTTISQTTTNQYYDFPANTFVEGEYERQVSTYDSQGVQGPWSTSGFFTVTVSPPSPSITNPVNNETISTEEEMLSWSAPNQSSYQAQVTTSADAVVYDSGEVQEPGTRFRLLQFPDNGVSRKIRVRIKYNGLWSQWTTITVNVSYDPPAAFGIIISPLDLKGIGVAHTLSVSTTHPAPVGSEPTVTSKDTYIRKQGDAGDGVRVDVSRPPILDFVYLTPSAGIEYEIRVKANGDNGVSTYSPWIAAPVLNFDGVLIHDPLDHDGSLLHIIHNSQGASDSFEVEHATLTYQGREFPAVEFGDASEHTVEVGLIQSLSGESAALRELVKRRTILCYRDGVGRKVYGVVGVNVIQDTFYGSDTSVSFTEVDYSEAV